MGQEFRPELKKSNQNAQSLAIFIANQAVFW